MSGDDLRAEAQRWLRYTEKDLSAAAAGLVRPGAVPRHACWLAQQSAEKAIKAALISLGVDFPRRHDLDALRNLLPQGWDVKRARPDLAALTEWAVEARYPGDWPEATQDDADTAVAQARAVVESIRRDLAAASPIEIEEEV